jgi:uncharacterized membrane protein (UPF0127 family)
MPIKPSCRSLLALLCLACSACAEDTPRVTLAGETYRVTIADDDQERARGLMFVESMPADVGMLFLFDDEQPRSFWMKNTRIPLDIIYFDRDRRLVSVSRDARPCRTARCAHYPSAGPAQYVLELNAGEADRLGLQPGMPIVFELD